MGIEAATYVVTCDAKVAADCRRTESVVREFQPNDRAPNAIVPPNWTQSKAGIACPECSAVET